MVRWTRKEKSALVIAVRKHKKGNWHRIIEDPEFRNVLGRHSTKSLEDKWRLMCKKNNVVSARSNDEAPVDILTLLKESGILKSLNSENGSEREKAVVELTKLASTKSIAPGDFSEVCMTLKKLMTDANSAVAVESIQAIGNLARGLRTHFSANSQLMLPYLLKNLEKEPTVAEALTQTLQAMYEAGCLNLVDIIEGVKTAVKNKVPRVRSSILNWVTFCLEISNKAPILEEYKEYLSLCRECLNDESREVRDAAFLACTALAKNAANLKAEVKSTAAKALATAAAAKATAAEAEKAAKEAVAFAAMVKEAAKKAEAALEL